MDERHGTPKRFEIVINLNQYPLENTPHIYIYIYIYILNTLNVWVLIAIITLNAVVPDNGTRHCATATAKYSKPHYTCSTIPDERLHLFHIFLYKFNTQDIITQTKHCKSQNVWFCAKMIK